jgi:hypothetical protein
MDERCLGLLSYTGERGLCPDPIPACNRAWRAKAPCDAHRWLVNLLNFYPAKVVLALVSSYLLLLSGLCGYMVTAASKQGERNQPYFESLLIYSVILNPSS